MTETAPPIRYGLIAPRAPEGAVDLNEVLPGTGPIEIDIGFGRGMSVFERARVAPGSRILGIEIKSKLATWVDERRKREGLDRVRIFCGDAREILSRTGPDGSVARVFVHFPDPWWKKRHQHRRVVGEAFLDEVARLLEPGGELYVQTDVEDRAQLYLDAIREHPAFLLATPTGLIEKNPYGARSNRERRADEDGLPVYRILAQRRGLAALPGRDPKCGGSLAER
ncbi:MAG: tRNA (guanosine(46)-N7)-methyltransferase TrmB [Polyangiales bacterium]